MTEVSPHGAAAANGGAARRALPPVALALLGVAFVLSALLWWQHAPRFLVFDAKSYGVFWSRRAWMLLHVVGGTVPLLAGPLLLWSGHARWRPPWHRALGKVYLGSGAVGVGAGAALSWIAALEPRALYVATFVLALAWFAAAGMAWRAIGHRRIEQHRQWMIRSYVLTFTFVACRIVMKAPLVGALGSEAIVAVVWASWIVPLLVTEVALQWRAGSDS